MAETQDEKPRTETTNTAPPQEEEWMGLGRYLLMRIPTLKPPMNPAPNPIKALMLLNGEQWLFFLVCAPHPSSHQVYLLTF